MKEQTLIEEHTEAFCEAGYYFEYVKPEKVQEIVNAKVLEALEREFEGVSIYLGIEERTTGKEYYETEVRPKYK